MQASGRKARAAGANTNWVAVKGSNIMSGAPNAAPVAHFFQHLRVPDGDVRGVGRFTVLLVPDSTQSFVDLFGRRAVACRPTASADMQGAETSG